MLVFLFGQDRREIDPCMTVLPDRIAHVDPSHGGCFLGELFLRNGSRPNQQRLFSIFKPMDRSPAQALQTLSDGIDVPLIPSFGNPRHEGAAAIGADYLRAALHHGDGVGRVRCCPALADVA